MSPFGKHTRRNATVSKFFSLPRRIGFNCGHELDADTLALWRLDEATAGTGVLATIVDSASGGRDLTTFGDPAPNISRAPDFAQYARWFEGATGGADRAGDAEGVTLFLGSWSIECWVYFDDSSGQDGTLFSYATIGETEATNDLVEILILTNNAIRISWEHDAGVISSFTTSANALTGGTWHHLAVTKTLTTDAVVRVYVDGVLVGTSGNLTNATGGTSSKWQLSVGNGFNDWRGGIRSMRISNVVRTLTEIETNATSATHSHDLDASTVVLWRMDESPDILDESTNGFDLMLTEGSFGLCKLLCQSSGRDFDGATSYDSPDRGHPTQADMVAAALADYTFEAWIRNDVALGVSDLAGLYCIGDPAQGEDSTHNYSGFVFIGRKGRYDHERSGGINVTYTTTADIYSAAAELALHHIAIVKFMSGGSAFVEFWLDGVLIETSTALTNMTGASLDKFHLGFGPSGALRKYWNGCIAECRLSAKRRTAAEIAASASRR